MSRKDLRIIAVKRVYDTGNIKAFKDIFVFIPRTVIAGALRINNNRFAKLIENPDKFKLGEIRKMAELFDIDYLQFLTLVVGGKPPVNKPLKKKSK
jgi:hypothetical protein